MFQLSRKARSLIPWLIFGLAVYGLFLYTLCATFNINDSGETISVAYRLAIGHSPGYPLHTVAGRMFCLLPVGSMAYRVTLLSAMLSALTVVLLARFFFHFCRDLVFAEAQTETTGRKLVTRKFVLAWAFASALFFGFSETFWFQAIGAKGGIYALNSFFLAAITLCLYGWWRLNRRRPVSDLRGEKYLLLFFFLFGLAVSHHWQALTFVPAYMAFLLPKYLKQLLRKPVVLLRHLGCVLLGFLPLLYLPLRAQHKMFLNWGEPNTWERFKWVLMREGYRNLGAEHGTDLWGRNLARFWLVFKEQFQDPAHHRVFSYLLFAFMLGMAALGIYYIFRRLRVFALYSVGLSGLLLGGVIFYANPNPGYEWVLDNFFSAFYFMLVVWVSAGLFFLWFFLRQRKAWAQKLVAPLLVVLLAGTYISNFPVADGRGYYFSYDYGRNILRSCPQGALLFCAGDIDILPLWYLHYVEGMRPDVSVVTVQLLPYEWYRRDLAREYPFLATPQLKGNGVPQQKATDVIIANLQQRMPICYSFIYVRPWLMSRPSLPQGIVNRLVNEREKAAGIDVELDRRIWDGFVLRQTLAESSYLDRYTRVLVDNYGLTRESIGLLLIKQRRFAEAMDYYRQALLYRAQRAHESIYFAMAHCAAGLSDFQAVVVYFRKCLEINPKNFAARVNLASYYGQAGNLRASLREYRLAQKIKPSDLNLTRMVASLERQLLTGQRGIPRR